MTRNAKATRPPNSSAGWCDALAARSSISAPRQRDSQPDTAATRATRASDMERNAATWIGCQPIGSNPRFASRYAPASSDPTCVPRPSPIGTPSTGPSGLSSRSRSLTSTPGCAAPRTPSSATSSPPRPARCPKRSAATASGRWPRPSRTSAADTESSPRSSTPTVRMPWPMSTSLVWVATQVTGHCRCGTSAYG